MRRRWLIAVAFVLLAAYLTGPFVDSGVFLSRPYVRLVSWSDGLEGFGVCQTVTSAFPARRRCG